VPTVQAAPVAAGLGFPGIGFAAVPATTAPVADIRSISFQGAGLEVDNFTFTTSVPELESYALMPVAAALTVADRRATTRRVAIRGARGPRAICHDALTRHH